ncbi:hypothetical protein ABPG75_013053 [Micractinium tetrahymenae]
MASDLPFEMLERIFSLPDPFGYRGELLLDEKQRASLTRGLPDLRCQLVFKAWRQALHPQRWPLARLELEAEEPDDEPAAALWAQRLQPGVQCSSFELCREKKTA